jgi:CheY-like chemotaxis protein
MKRVLAVDDEQDLLDVVSEFFAGRYDVVTATSGEAALEMIRRQRPDVVFLDVDMPGLSGLEVLKRPRQSPSLPIIMVTVNTEIATAEVYLREGAFAFVPKPFDLNYMNHMAALATGA